MIFEPSAIAQTFNAGVNKGIDAPYLGEKMLYMAKRRIGASKDCWTRWYAPSASQSRLKE